MPSTTRPHMAWLVVLPLFAASPSVHAADVPVEFDGFRGGGVQVRHEGSTLSLFWPTAPRQLGRLVVDLRTGAPLIRNLGLIRGTSLSGKAVTLLEEVDPATFVTVGTRVAPVGRPPTMSDFNVFFDNPAQRPHQTYITRLELRRVRVTNTPGRTTVAVGDLTAGPFAGELHITVYAGAPLVHVEAVLSTHEPKCAFVYDAGLVSRAPGWNALAWYDTDGRFRRAAAKLDDPDEPRAVRYRALAVDSPGGSVACFPPPHQYFYPRDLSDNQATVWAGRNHRMLEPRAGFGIRQTETGGGGFVPWFNAPPGTSQRMGVFYALGDGPAEETLRGILRFTRGDRFADLPGHVTFTSHWHMAIAMAALEEIRRGGRRTTPDFVRMFKDMNVRLVHIAEFHGDGHPQDPGPLRLPELKAMYDECGRLSDDRVTFLPGEEANAHFGVKKPGQHPGHWIELFPHPVYWTMNRAPGQPFAETIEPYGKVYHTGDPADMSMLLEEERGLAWTAHPRIKASSWAPDAYRDDSYFAADFWLGAAWKAMPADLSRPKLGERVLDLLDDMANWHGKLGQPKYVLGETDLFKINHTHELYGHMNVNYLRLAHAPRYEEDWTPVLDALRNGAFFVTTGEVLLTEFSVGGKLSGETARLHYVGGERVRIGLEATFPLAFAEVISGDGEKVHRERIDLSDTAPFERLTREFWLELRGRNWVRVEAWDVADNGVFSQPVWLTRPPID